MSAIRFQAPSDPVCIPTRTIHHNLEPGPLWVVMLQAGPLRGCPRLKTEVIHLTQTMTQIFKSVKETINLESLCFFVMLESGILTYLFFCCRKMPKFPNYFQ